MYTIAVRNTVIFGVDACVWSQIGNGGAHEVADLFDRDSRSV